MITLKLYRCEILDESMPDWESVIIAVMESKEEQDYYYSHKNEVGIRKKLLTDSHYRSIAEDDIEFWFAYEIDGINYANEIANNICQYVCDADYCNFVIIEADMKRSE